MDAWRWNTTLYTQACLQVTILRVTTGVKRNVLALTVLSENLMSDLTSGARMLDPGKPKYNAAMTSTYPSSSRNPLFPRNYTQKKNPDIDVDSITRSVLLDGTEHVVSHEGTSQYNRDGSGASACGLAALNFARVVFLKEQDGLRDAALLQAVLSRDCAEVRKCYPLRLPSKHRLTPPGNYCSVRTMVWKPSSGGRGHLPRSRIR